MMYSIFSTLISLMLVRIIIEKICVVIFESQDCWIVRTSLPFKVIIEANRNKSNGLYKLPSNNQHIVLLQLFIIDNTTWIDLQHMPLDISTTKHWHSRGIPYISITSQFCDECTLGITCHTCKKVGELHHCVEAMLEYYDVTLNLELCPWFTRCLIVKLL